MKKKNIGFLCAVLVVMIIVTIAAFFFVRVNGNKEDVASLALELRDSSVRINVENASGSGVIVSKEKDGIYIATCAHLLKDFNQGIVTLSDGNTIFGDVICINKDTDLCILKVSSEYIDERLFNKIKPVSVKKNALNGVKEEDSVLLVGSALSVGSNQVLGEVISLCYFVPEYNMNMIYLYCDAMPGMSGAGTFDLYGNLIGIVSAASETSEVLVIPLTDLLKELEDIENDKN